MNSRRFVPSSLAIWLVAITLAITARAPAGSTDPNLIASENAPGQLRTFAATGSIDLDNPFFQDLGTNGRRCGSCHQADSAWTITPQNVRARFRATDGTDPIFANNDGSNCEGAMPNSVEERTAAYSLLLTRGLIRVGLDVPADAEFVIEHIDAPFHCGPATNDATRGHAQAARDLTANEVQQIVAFETSLFTAQAHNDAGNLHARGATGGPVDLSRQLFFIGINDPVNLNPAGLAFDPNAFTLFNAWASLAASSQTDGDAEMRAHVSVARGQAIFNTRPFTIAGVAGLNGETFASGVTVPDSFTGTCTVCHDTPNAGDHSVRAPLNIGVADPGRATYLPVYHLTNLATGETTQTTDPGRAMITGKWRDVGRFKGPILRALAARAPYFHNGFAATLQEVVEFYQARFNIQFTARDKADLIAFLRSL